MLDAMTAPKRRTLEVCLLACARVLRDAVDRVRHATKGLDALRLPGVVFRLS